MIETNDNEGFDAEPSGFKSYSLGFRVSQEFLDDLLNPQPAPPPTLRTKIVGWWREVTWRIEHAWDALVHGNCDYID